MADGVLSRLTGWFQNLHQLQVGIILLVGVSGGLIAVFGDASLAGVAVATVGGLVLGVLLTWYLTRIAPDSGEYGRKG